jgi:hypothetical protein
MKHKPSHNGIEIDVRQLTGRNVEYKRQFAFMLLIKSKYRNSMVYDYSPRTLSNKLNLSVFVTEKYITGLLKLGYCHFKGSHLQFISLNDIMPYRQHGEVIIVNKNDGIQNIIEQINILIIKQNITNQNTLIQVKSDLIKATSNQRIDLKSYRRSQKFAKSYPKISDERLTEFNVLGMRRIAELLGCSLYTASQFINRLVTKKLIWIERVITKVKNLPMFDLSSSEVKSGLNVTLGYFYSFMGVTYHYMGTRIEFL